jgi:hypothetical protein
MKSTQNAAGQPAGAGTLHACAFKSIQTSEINMTAQTNSNKPACVDFSLLSNYASQLARTLGMDIVSFPEGFTAVKDGEVISGEYNSKELEAWFNGYESGKDDIEIAVRLADAKLVLAELVKAEQVIQSMMAAMTDTQKQTVANSLCVVGIGGAKSACRSGERHEVILTSLPAINGSAA